MLRQLDCVLKRTNASLCLECIISTFKLHVKRTGLTCCNKKLRIITEKLAKESCRSDLLSVRSSHQPVCDQILSASERAIRTEDKDLEKSDEWLQYRSSTHAERHSICRKKCMCTLYSIRKEEREERKTSVCSMSDKKISA